jgi:hypothetical protein
MRRHRAAQVDQAARQPTGGEDTESGTLLRRGPPCKACQSLMAKRISAVPLLQAYQLYMAAICFKKVAMEAVVFSESGGHLCKATRHQLRARAQAAAPVARSPKEHQEQGHRKIPLRWLLLLPAILHIVVPR